MDRLTRVNIFNADGERVIEHKIVHGSTTHEEFSRFHVELRVPGQEELRGEVVLYPQGHIYLGWAQEGGGSARKGHRILRVLTTRRGFERAKRRLAKTAARFEATLSVDSFIEDYGTGVPGSGKTVEKRDECYRIEPGRPWRFVIESDEHLPVKYRLRSEVWVAAEGVLFFCDPETCDYPSMAPTLFKSEWEALTQDDSEVFAKALSRMADQSIDGCEIRALGYRRSGGRGGQMHLQAMAAHYNAIQCWRELIAHDGARGPLFVAVPYSESESPWRIRFANVVRADISRDDAWQQGNIHWGISPDKKTSLEAMDTASLAYLRHLAGTKWFDFCFNELMLHYTTPPPWPQNRPDIVEAIKRNRALVEQEALEKEMAPTERSGVSRL